MTKRGQHNPAFKARVALEAVIGEPTVALQFRRMANEQRVLWETFPEYDDYARRVPMFIPTFVGRRIHNGE